MSMVEDVIGAEISAPAADMWEDYKSAMGLFVLVMSKRSVFLAGFTAGAMFAAAGNLSEKMKETIRERARRQENTE